jgi:hypothetical protein
MTLSEVARSADRHRGTIDKSSKAITESAFVHRPTLPASLNV